MRSRLTSYPLPRGRRVCVYVRDTEEVKSKGRGSMEKSGKEGMKKASKQASLGRKGRRKKKESPKALLRQEALSVSR